MRASATLLIFAKAPEPGRVKTRLASHVGPLRAAQIHRELVRHSIANLSNGPWKTQLWCAPGCGHPFFQPYRQHRHLSLHRQQGGDLGQRMHHAMTAALRRSASAILIGSDCPYLTPDHLEAALDALRRGNDAVLIPARDGGYVLLGLRRPQATLFQDIPWGSPSVLTSTRARLRQARL
ncbi:MAG: TIGR04282 family arsenosugar biosynthesis glycosyltransferase, partial [Gammaproteobacteria bacterium]